MTLLDAMVKRNNKARLRYSGTKPATRIAVRMNGPAKRAKRRQVYEEFMDICYSVKEMKFDGFYKM